ncbi:MAG: helix-turn-helix transcriptional regulator [Polyangiaceae bacterium]
MPGPRSGATTIDVVEQIYAEIGTTPIPAWFLETAKAMTRCFGQGLGAIAYFYDVAGPRSRWSISHLLVHDAPTELADVVRICFAQTPPEFTYRCYHDVGLSGTFSEQMGIDFRQLACSTGSDAAIRYGIVDQIFVHAGNPDDTGVLVTLNVAERRRLVPAERRRIAMVGAHMAAAARLVQSLGTLRPPVAVFDPDGRTRHIERDHESMREPLREYVRAVERARTTKAREEPDAALATWRALLAGEYTLLDRFESDGRRFVVAIPNRPAVRDPRGLSPREAVVAAWAARGHSDKLIAYELGVATGTVTALMNRALRKLGAKTRTELARRMTPPTDIERVRVDGEQELVVLSSTSDGADDARLASLSDAERAVVLEAAKGMRNDDIARRRGVSAKTIANQLASAYKKLGVATRVDLVPLVGPRPRP